MYSWRFRWTASNPAGGPLFKAAGARLFARQRGLILVAVAMGDGSEQPIWGDAATTAEAEKRL